MSGTLTLTHHADNGDITKTLYAPAVGEFVDGKFTIVQPGDNIPYSEIIKNEGLKEQILGNSQRFHGDPKLYYLVPNSIPPGGFSYFPIIGAPADFKAANGIVNDFVNDYPLTYGDGVPWDSDGFMPNEQHLKSRVGIIIEGIGVNTEEVVEEAKTEEVVEVVEVIDEVKEAKWHPNKLHELASYSVQYDFYMMRFEDFNHIQDTLIRGGDNLPSLAFDFIKKPGRLLISSAGIQHEMKSGTSTNNRYFTRDYHIDDIEIMTILGPNHKTGGAKHMTTEMKVLEPFGATFVENIVRATVDNGGSDWAQMPYMLKISFKGWNDDGTPKTIGESTKYLMLKLNNITFNVSERGTEYELSLSRYGDQIFQSPNNVIPTDIQVNTETIGQFFGFTEAGGDSTGTEYGPLEEEIDDNSLQITLDLPYNDNTSSGVAEMSSEIKNVTLKDQTMVTHNSFLTPSHSGYAEGTSGERTVQKAYSKPTGRIFKNFTDILNQQNKEEWKILDKATPEHPDTYEFMLDSGCGEEIYNKFLNSTVLKADSLGADRTPVWPDIVDHAVHQGLHGIETSGISPMPVNANSMALQLARGASIITCINTIISTSTFMTDQVTVVPGVPQLGYQATYSLEESEESPIWLYKITPVVTVGKWDSIRKVYQKHIKYVISLYKSYGRVQPATPFIGVDDVVKHYDWLYTGKNKDVLDFDLQFNAAAFEKTIVGGYTKGLESLVNKQDTQPTPSGASHYQTSLFNTGYYLTYDNDAIWQAGSTSDYRTVMAKNFMSRIYQDGVDKLKGTLKIIGDPEFITQDEGFGLGSHSTLFINGSINTHKDPIVLINFMTPPDIDTNTGLLDTHSGDARGGGNSISIFSGYYRVMTVTTSIQNNLFTQELDLIRVEVQEEVDIINEESTIEKDSTSKLEPHKFAYEKGSPIMSDQLFNTITNFGDSHSTRNSLAKMRPAYTVRMDDAKEKMLRSKTIDMGNYAVFYDIIDGVPQLGIDTTYKYEKTMYFLDPQVIITDDSGQLMVK